MLRAILLTFFLPGLPLFAGLTWETTLKEVRPEAGEKSVTVGFPFSNPGAEAIKITGIVTSCGCTTAKIAEREIPPGGTGVVEVRFDFGNRRGEQVKMAVVKTSDREVHKLLLKVDLPEK